MRFSRSTHLLMFLSLKILTSIISTELVKLIKLLNSVIIFLSQLTSLKWLTFLHGSQTVILIILLFSTYFFLLSIVFVLQWLFLHGEILIMLLFQFLLTFHQIHNGMPCFISYLMSILVLIRMAIVIIWEMFHGRISLSLVLLLLLVNFVSGFGLELMHISLIENIGWSHIHLHGFQLLALLP